MITVYATVQVTRKYKFKDCFGVENIIDYINEHGDIPTDSSDFVGSDLMNETEVLLKDYEIDIFKDEDLIATL